MLRLNRNLLALSFLLITISVVAQQKNTIKKTIEWESPKIFSEGEGSLAKPITVPYFKTASYRITESILPDFCDRTRIGGNPNDVDVVFTSTSFTTLTQQEINLIKKQKVAENVTINANIAYEKGEAYLNYCFSPIRKNPTTGQYEKLVAFEINATPKTTFTSSSANQKRSSRAGQSVLSTGNWYKIAVNQDGIYKLDREFFQQMGLSPGSIDPRNIRIYGNGGGMLPEANDEFRYDDLQENAIYVEGEADGTFNQNDYVLFYGQSQHRWVYNDTEQRFRHIYNIYSERTFYFITVDAGAGKRLAAKPQSTNTITHNINTFDDYKFLESEEENLVGSGRRWFGEFYDFTNSYNFPFNFPNAVQSDPALYKIVAVARSSVAGTKMDLKYNGTDIGSFSFSPVTSNVSSSFVSQTVDSGTLALNATNTDNITFTISYDNSVNPSAFAWMDYIEMQVRRELNMVGIGQRGQLFFRDQPSVGAGNTVAYTISNVSANTMVWDITDPINAQNQNTTSVGGDLNFIADADELREYVAFNRTNNNFPEPDFIGTVANQNLHALQQIEYIIVSHPSLATEAERLAEFHRNNDGMTVEVVTTTQVYNEFSSGAQDITAIKDLMRMLYKDAVTPADAPKYLLLFGDASYDYKDIFPDNTNFVPIYQSPASFTLYNSYATDDYFGFLDDNEGKVMINELLDIGIGRFPVKSVAEARIAVDKAINYASSNTLGDWRNEVIFVADDRDEGWESALIGGAEDVAQKVEQDHKIFNLTKIYLDSYVQTSGVGGERYPDASNDFFRKAERGALLVSWVGHGGEVGWATERVLELSQVNAWKNYNNTPIFVTITCEFSRYDDPLRVSAGEQAFLSPTGAAAALFSTTRVVFESSANDLNGHFFDTVFTQVNGEYLRMGEIIRIAKNSKTGSDNDKLNFALIGDPAMRMAVPEYNVVTTTINGTDVTTGAVDTISALSFVTITGEVRDDNDQLMTNFNGVVTPAVYDKAKQRSTLVNDGVGNPINYEAQENVLFKGKVQVQNGVFSFSFVVPRDISFTVGNGRISYYAEDGNVDAAGYFEDFIVAGIDGSAVNDNGGPAVELFMNDENFVFGGLTDEDPVLLAKVIDSSGVNTVGNGIGHDIIATLDDDTDQQEILNEFFEADLNSYQSGTIRFPYFDIEPGRHTISLRVWDVHNNPGIAKTEFIVAESAELALERVLNYPNPFTTYTEFQFEHNRPNEPLQVQVQVLTVSGKLVKTLNTTVQSQGTRVAPIAWDGLDDYGDKIGRGVYVYRIRVRSLIDNSSDEEYEKLVILR